MKLNNFEIPKQIALIGYMDEKMASYLTPEFTTIDQHGIEIGEIAAKTLLEKLENSEKENDLIIVKSSINKKQTTH